MRVSATGVLANGEHKEELEAVMMAALQKALAEGITNPEELKVRITKARNEWQSTS
jgi:hypothetical protein